jgi:hypothetical protein
VTVKETLEQARALISDESRWTTGANARTQTGVLIKARSEGAKRWCASGALYAVGDPTCEARVLLAQAANDLFGDSPTLVNDYRGHAAVLAMYDIAIESSA